MFGGQLTKKELTFKENGGGVLTSVFEEMKEFSHTVSSHVKNRSFEKPKLFSHKENIFLLLLNIVYIATLELFFFSGAGYLSP